MKAPKPCIEAGCPSYAVLGKARCQPHHDRATRDRLISNGSTPAWRAARQVALERAGNRCSKCDRSAEQAKADGTWLEVHHVSGAGVRAEHHDLADLRVLCRDPCHLDTRRRGTRQTWEERKAEIAASVGKLPRMPS